MITEVRNLKTSTENLGTHGEIRRYALVVPMITTPSLRLVNKKTNSFKTNKSQKPNLLWAHHKVFPCSGMA